MRPISTLLLLLLLTACSSVESRIEKNPAAFDRLSAKDKKLVRAGDVREGMTPEAVQLAWGKPTRKSQVREEGVSYEVWNYYQYHHDFEPSYTYAPRRVGGRVVYDNFYTPRTATRASFERGAVFKKGKLISYEKPDEE